MTVFGAASGSSGGGAKAGRGPQQVHPMGAVEAEEVSQRLVEAVHKGDFRSVAECLAYRWVDVNYTGAVVLRSRRAEVVLREEEPDDVRFEYEELRTDASPLFLAAHIGALPLVRKLLNARADVNQKLFRGYATTAAVREGRAEILDMLLKAGAFQPACEEALLEACTHGRAKLAELIMASDLIRPNIAVHGLVLACCRGFVEVVDALIKSGVDANATDRVLLRSLKPSLHTNVDCNALFAAIVSRQGAVVRQLLQSGVKKDATVSLGAWSWDTATGEEFRVGAGLAEPYNMAWCAVEYFESTGSIIRMLLPHYSPKTLHFGRNLLHHAILCANARAVDTLLDSGADCEFPIKTSKGIEFRPIHMAARLGHHAILQCLINAKCDLNSTTDKGETALMLCAKYKRGECVRILISAGADLGLISPAGASAPIIAASERWSNGFQRAVLDVVRSHNVPHTTNHSVFSPVAFAARCGDVGALEALLMHPTINIDHQDENGFSALMIAAREGHVDAFRFLVFAGASAKLTNSAGETAINIPQSSKHKDQFEQIMLEFALDKGVRGGFQALHCAVRRGDLTAVRLLTSRGEDVNAADPNEYTPLMLAAKEGHGKVCELLITCGAKCDIRTSKGETALSLARANKAFGNDAEGVIMDELARLMVLHGGKVKKHTKCGKGRTHRMELKMVGNVGALRWVKERRKNSFLETLSCESGLLLWWFASSSRRNVICREAELGGSSAFMTNRRKKADLYEPGLFRVVTTKKREYHFVCEGGDEAAELWVRGIKLVTKGVFGKLMME